MIDLHSHILPGLDDGSTDIATSLEMARIAVADGITHMACTPHVVPGLYDNPVNTIVAAVEALRRRLSAADIPLSLYKGADVHIAPDLPEKLARGQVPTLNGTRYFLFEPPHHVLPPKIEELASRLIEAGFVPIITHPERLTWLAANYKVIERLNALGCMIQLTADSITGDFGKTALYYCERLADEGRVDIVASDCHGPNRRRPQLSRARMLMEARVGREEAARMFLYRPAAILANKAIEPVGLNALPSTEPEQLRRDDKALGGMLGRLFKGGA